MDSPGVESTDPDLTLEQVLEVEESGKCPDCGEYLDTGAGFGRRDLECWVEECGWSASYPIEIYLSRLGPVSPPGVDGDNGS